MGFIGKTLAMGAGCACLCSKNAAKPVDASLASRRARNQSEHIERKLQLSEAESRLHLKILLLGAGESGKTTVVKQLGFIHKTALSVDERKTYISVLHENTIQSMLLLIDAAQRAGSDLTTHREAIDRVLKLPLPLRLTAEAVKDIQTLWHECPSMSEMWEQRSSFWILECAPFFLEQCHRFIAPDYVPNEEDVIMARKRTTGVQTTEFDYATVHWSIVDVGGQRTERRKWLHCLDNVNAIIYVSNLASYARVLFEDGKVKGMDEDLELFQETAGQGFFDRVPVFLLLNKKDLFEQLLKSKPLTECFPKYNGDGGLMDSTQFIARQFENRLPGEKNLAQIHCIASRLKADVRCAFDDIKRELLRRNTHTIQAAKEVVRASSSSFSSSRQNTKTSVATTTLLISSSRKVQPPTRLSSEPQTPTKVQPGKDMEKGEQKKPPAE